jgi:hypothetical protein
MLKRDLAILILSTAAILLSFQSQFTYFSINPAWVVPLDASLFENGHSPGPHEQLYAIGSLPIHWLIMFSPKATTADN